MAAPFVMPKNAKDIGPYYTSEKHILSFQTKVWISSLEDEKMLSWKLVHHQRG